MAQLAGVVIDVGGTLWPDRWWPVTPEQCEERVARVQAALDCDRDLAARLTDRLEADAEALPGTLTQDSDELVRQAGAAFGLKLDKISIVALQKAMGIEAAGHVEPFPNAKPLLATIKALQLRCAVLSNGAWRGRAGYESDLEDFGLLRFIDAVLTSPTLGLRKPNRKAFEAALAALSLSSEACVMIGNSEKFDIEPALALGMRAIRVAIEEPRPEASKAHAIACSLHEVAELLRSWVWSEGSST
jgi:FMN phosphatase YigB (HAD superfamily)